MKRSAIILIALPAALLGTAAHAADPTHGRLLASQCFQCHGTNGKSAGKIDSIGGDLYNDLREMKTSTKPEDIMHQQARGYTDEEMRLIADYFATLPGGGSD